MADETNLDLSLRKIREWAISADDLFPMPVAAADLMHPAAASESLGHLDGNEGGAPEGTGGAFEAEANTGSSDIDEGVASGSSGYKKVGYGSPALSRRRC